MITRPIKPIYLKGKTKAGILLLHGFTGTPQCFEGYAHVFHAHGYTVSVPMLEGHATHHTLLEKTKWEDWYKSAEDALKEIAQDTEKIFVLGLSMGGLLTLHLAQNYPQIKAIGLLATPIYLDGFMVTKLFPLIWKTPLRWLYKYQKKYNASINDPVMKRKYQTYDHIPVKSVAEMLELQMIVRGELRFIHQPTFIGHSKLDRTVPYGNLDYIKASLGSRNIETLTLKKSNHIITLDFERDRLFKELLKFFGKKQKQKIF